MKRVGMTESIAQPTTFFFDTYAFFEIIRGNPGYAPYENAHALTTQFNIAEFNYALQRDQKPYAEKATRERAKSVVEVTLDDIIEAMTLRVQHKKLSIPDAIGYIVACRLGVKFLTGDQEFEHMENVEFVK